MSLQYGIQYPTQKNCDVIRSNIPFFFGWHISQEHVPKRSENYRYTYPVTIATIVIYQLLKTCPEKLNESGRSLWRCSVGPQRRGVAMGRGVGEGGWCG